MSDYSERRGVSLAGIVIALLTPTAVAWVFLAVDSLIYAAVATAVVAIGVGALTFVRARERVSVSPEGIRVGTVMLETAWIGDVSDFTGAAWADALRSAGHSRSWLSTRSFHDGGVRIMNTDPHDRVAEWFVSSRNPMALASAIRQTKVGSAN